MIASAAWFACDFDPSRAARLFEFRSYGDVLRTLESDFCVHSCCWEPFTNIRLLGCSRIVFGVQVSCVAYDAFFNAPEGYRGQYAKHAERGSQANRETILLLIERLMTGAKALGIENTERINTSLNAPQAKIWIREAEVDAQFEKPPAIVWKTWRRALGSGKGLRAPEGRDLEVKGGWIDEAGTVNEDTLKAMRSVEIYRSGYS